MAVSPNPPAELTQLDPAEAWKPWQPDAGNPWSLKWAGHLHRRAAFGATWMELRAAVQEGPEETLRKLLEGKDGQADFDQFMDSVDPPPSPNQGFDAHDDALQSWWLYRMIGTLHPLRERLTLFWHNHFATSIAKVQQPELMKKQNVLLRKHALGKFRPFLLEVSRDPAMLIWLDSNSNVKGRPNENYARELLELFTLGTGHYTEHDVRQAARAFTGWHTTGPDNLNGVRPDQEVQFSFRRFAHDDGPKTFLGQTGNWDGGDIVRIVLEQKAAATFLVRKFYRHFISESQTPPDHFLEPLADQFRKSEYDVAVLMRALLGSRHFFSDYAYRQRIKGPAEFLVGMLRSLEARTGEGGLVALPAPLDGLGQRLFAPPSVKGWDGGKAWLNSATLLARHNLAWRFLQGVRGPYGVRVNPLELVRRYSDGKDYARQVDFLLQLLLQAEAQGVDDRARQQLVEFLAKDQPRGPALERRLRETVHAIMLMPEYQLA